MLSILTQRSAVFLHTYWPCRCSWLCEPVVFVPDAWGGDGMGDRCAGPLQTGGCPPPLLERCVYRITKPSGLREIEIEPSHHPVLLLDDLRASERLLQYLEGCEPCRGQRKAKEFSSVVEVSRERAKLGYAGRLIWKTYPGQGSAGNSDCVHDGWPGRW